jgi:hypothetical protein
LDLRLCCVHDGDGTNDGTPASKNGSENGLEPEKAEADRDELKAVMNAFQEKMDSSQEKARPAWQN